MPVTVQTAQSALAALTRAMGATNALLCHPLVTGLQFHGVLFGLLLGTLWAASGYMRLRELRRQHAARQQRGSGAAAQQQQQQQQQQQAPGRQAAAGARVQPQGQQAGEAEESAGAGEPPPGVTIVLPVRGCRAHSLANWRAILEMDHGGALDVVFVLEDKADPACAAIGQLLRELAAIAAGKEQAGGGQGAAGAGAGRRSGSSRGGMNGTAGSGTAARMEFSGQAADTSQKIHNLMAGIRGAAPGSSYLLCLDDDVQPHPGLLAALVADMQADPSLFMATGYPFDVPPPGAGMLTYAVLTYHLPLVIAFSLRQRTSFVWGGCMLFRTSDLRADSQGLLKAWSAGGYSDDLTVASLCTERGLPIHCPSYAIFPQWLEGGHAPRLWWNYLRRQLCVLDTYSSPHNRRTNHTMAALHCYASWGFALPAGAAAARLALWALALLLLPSQKVYGGSAEPSSYLWLRLFGVEDCPWGLVSWLAFTGAAAYAVAALCWMTGVILDLFCELNPRLARPQLETFHWAKLWAAFVASNALLPFCMAYTFCTTHIDWSGVRYWRRGGRVVCVQHSYAVGGGGSGGPLGASSQAAREQSAQAR